jgi:hypothetical protein
MARQAGSTQFSDFTTGFTSTKKRGLRRWHGKQVVLNLL